MLHRALIVIAKASTCKVFQSSKLTEPSVLRVLKRGLGEELVVVSREVDALYADMFRERRSAGHVGMQRLVELSSSLVVLRVTVTNVQAKARLHLWLEWGQVIVIARERERKR